MPTWSNTKKIGTNFFTFIISNTQMTVWKTFIGLKKLLKQIFVIPFMQMQKLQQKKNGKNTDIYFKCT